MMVWVRYPAVDFLHGHGYNPARLIHRTISRSFDNAACPYRQVCTPAFPFPPPRDHSAPTSQYSLPGSTFSRSRTEGSLSPETTARSSPMRYFLIDKIDTITPGKSITATKTVSLSEDIFADHFIGAPVLPGALMIEAMAQAGTALLEISSSHTKKALLVLVQNTKFRKVVRPGVILTLHMRVVSSDASSALCDGTIMLGDEVCAEGSLAFSLQDAAAYYPQKTRHLVEALYDTWLRDAIIAKEET